ncbi:AraC family transcriptional regulator N-terminal domain-containing protein [Desulfovibrio desulfuricans]|uniref:AraC family transcriptional regulator n=1 Tax=Desulfovibrio desulfuricans TaxID=876 RepID=UPI0035B33CE8
MPDMAELLEELATVDGGSVHSPIKGVRFFKNTKQTRRKPLLYTPGICIVASGYKLGHLGGQTFRYDAGNYLVTSISMPFECESFPNGNEPLLGLFIDIDVVQLNDLIRQVDMHNEPRQTGPQDFQLAIGPSAMDEEMKDATIRLLKAHRSEQETRILGPSYVREIHYRALCGSQAPVLLSAARGSGSLAQVLNAINLMERSYQDKFDIKQLAVSAHMSTSAFHKAFKDITADSPLQYLKKIRLAKARDLIVQRSMRANLAASEVGYESPSQFSREFKRYFGESPAEVMREMRSS